MTAAWIDEAGMSGAKAVMRELESRKFPGGDQQREVAIHCLIVEAIQRHMPDALLVPRELLQRLLSAQHWYTPGEFGGEVHDAECQACAARAELRALLGKDGEA